MTIDDKAERSLSAVNAMAPMIRMKNRLSSPVWPHSEQALRDGLVADCVSQHRRYVRRALIEEGVGREEAELLPVQIVLASRKMSGPPAR